MDYLVSSSEYKELVTNLYTLIKTEIENVKDIEQQYPKFVVMYEFFRLLRGESFTTLREPLEEYQSEVYKMEDEIFRMLEEMKKNILIDSEKAKSSYENMVSIGLRI